MTQAKSALFQVGLVAALAACVGVVAGFLLAKGLMVSQPAAPVAKAEQPVVVPVVDTAELEDKIFARVSKEVLAELQKARPEPVAQVDKPATPVVNKPATPVVNKPATPVVNKPATPAVNRPAQPAAVDDGGQPMSVAADWKEDISKYKTELGDSPAVGPDSALVKVFIISDFQCPVCKRAAEGMESIFGKARGKVQYVFWQNPLEMHRKALPTAKASMAAFAQGSFWDYHDLLFANQRAAEPSDLLGYASRLGLSMDKFRQDMESEALLKKLQSDQSASVLMGTRGTPSFIINGRKQVGWGSAAGIESMVQRELREMEKLLAAGKTREEALKERVVANAATPEEADAFMKHFIEGKAAR